MFLVTRVPRNIAVSSAHPLRQIADGLAYVGQNKLVLGTITLDLFAVFLAGTNALLPIYAHDILHVGPRGLSELAAARSEEHTSELQSLMRISYAVFCLKKKKHRTL